MGRPVIPFPVTPSPVVAGWSAGTDAAVLAAASAEARYRRCALRVVHADADPVEYLLREAAYGSLLVLGHRRRGRRADSVALRLLDRSPIPVLVHGRAAPAEPRPVLAAVPATDVDPVLDLAFFEAAGRGAELVAVRVYAPGDRDGAGCLLAGALARWADKYPDVPARQLVKPGLDATVSLTALTGAAQLVVVGTRPDHTVAGLHGSVAQTLVHRGGCPVLTVPR